MWQLPALAARAFAPGTAKCEANSTFIVETGGRLAPSATAILRSWAQVAAGDEPGGGALSLRALSHYKRTQRLICSDGMRAISTRPPSGWPRTLAALACTSGSRAASR